MNAPRKTTDQELNAALVRLAAAKRTRDTVSLAYAADPSQALADCATNAEVAFETALAAVVDAHGSWSPKERLS